MRIEHGNSARAEAPDLEKGGPDQGLRLPQNAAMRQASSLATQRLPVISLGPLKVPPSYVSKSSKMSLKLSAIPARFLDAVF